MDISNERLNFIILVDFRYAEIILPVNFYLTNALQKRLLNLAGAKMVKYFPMDLNI